MTIYNFGTKIINGYVCLSAVTASNGCNVFRNVKAKNRISCKNILLKRIKKIK